MKGKGNNLPDRDSGRRTWLKVDSEKQRIAEGAKSNQYHYRHPSRLKGVGGNELSNVGVPDRLRDGPGPLKGAGQQMLRGSQRYGGMHQSQSIGNEQTGETSSKAPGLPSAGQKHFSNPTPFEDRITSEMPAIVDYNRTK
jgi:hypothetical protein